MMDTTPDHAQKIVHLVERIGRLVRGMQHVEGIKPAQWEALRYLAKANRFSRSPGALSEFLGSTRGTVSQTLIALEKKGLLKRLPSLRDGRGTALELTEEGRALVARDPLKDLEALTDGLEPVDAAALEKGLGEVLRRLQHKNGFRAFGVCHTCRFFREAASNAEPGGPHRCGITGELLSPDDSLLICREHKAKVA